MGMFVVIIFILVFYLLIIFTFIPISTWIKALSAGLNLSFMDFVGMRLRNIPHEKIVDNLIKLKNAGLNVTVRDLQAHHLAGGNTDRLCNALIEAKSRNKNIDFATAADMELSGRDIMETLDDRSREKVLETPLIKGVTMDRVKINGRAKITVKPKKPCSEPEVEEEIITAKVCSGILSLICSTGSAAELREKANSISREVMMRDPAGDTAFSVLSIDILELSSENENLNISASVGVNVCPECGWRENIQQQFCTQCGAKLY